jgi:beta-lactamase regulating signal transducer with metallopeptidase domain
MSALANWYPGHWVLDFGVIAAATVTLVTAAAWMVSLFLKRHPAIRHWVQLSALVASLASPLLALGFIASGRSFISVPLLIAEDAALAPELPDEVNPSPNMQAEHGHSRFLDEPAASVAPETFLRAHRTSPAKAEAVRDHVATAEPQKKSLPVDPAAGSANPFQSALVAVILVWLCGTLVVILGLFRGVLLLRRLCRSVRPLTDAELGHAVAEARRLVGARSLPAVGVSSLARSPLVAGLFRPIIVIPRNLLGAIEGHELRDILMHEIAHVERRDNLVVLLQAIARAAFWPIPFLHLLNRELERAREEICDNHVLVCRDAASYGETLLRVACLACGTGMPVGTVGILHWRGKLEDRIFGLVHKGRSKMTRLHPLIALGVLTLFLSASAILCGTTIVAAQPPQTASDKPAVAQEQAVTPQKPEKAQEKEPFTAWGKEVGGLQAGIGFRPGEKRAYRHGETVTLVVRVRNVGNEDVKFRYLKELFMENPPTVTGGEGKTIRQGGLDLFGSIAQIPVDVNLAPGKELELHDLKLKLAPASGSGDVTEVSPETLNGKGTFQIQYEQLAAASIDPNLTKLATGKLELVVKDAEKLPEKGDQKEAFTAWGKEINGLQAGLGFRPGEKRTYRHGEGVAVVLRVRNVGKEEVEFKHIWAFFGENPPTITDADGKRVPVLGSKPLGLQMPRKTSVAPGKEVVLYEWSFDLRAQGEESRKGCPTIFGTGKFSLQSERVVGPTFANPNHPNPALDKLATGKLELEVTEAEKVPEKKEEQEAFTAWGKEIVGGGLQAGLGFRPGEKRAYRHGETVTLVVRVRNTGRAKAHVFLIELPPTITDARGKSIDVALAPSEGRHVTKPADLAPEQEIDLYELTLELRPESERGKKEPRALYGSGKVKIECKVILGESTARFNSLETGKLELEIKSDPP